VIQTQTLKYVPVNFSDACRGQHFQLMKTLPWHLCWETEERKH